MLRCIIYNPDVLMGGMTYHDIVRWPSFEDPFAHFWNEELLKSVEDGRALSAAGVVADGAGEPLAVLADRRLVDDGADRKSVV